jgi:hypothetical protein
MNQEEMQEYFLSKTNFSKSVEKLVLLGKGDISFIEAVISVAEVSKIELEDIKKFLSPEIQRKIELEAMENKLISSSSNEHDEEALSIFFE